MSNMSRYIAPYLGLSKPFGGPIDVWMTPATMMEVPCDAGPRRAQSGKVGIPAAWWFNAPLPSAPRHPSTSPISRRGAAADAVVDGEDVVIGLQGPPR